LADPVTMNKFKRNPELGALRQQYATAMKNLKKMADGGVRIALGTNSGSPDTYPGYFELREMISMVEAGMQPMYVIKAATVVPAAHVCALTLPNRKGSKADIKAGPPDRIPVAVRASAADLRDFYSKARPAYKWSAAGNCWQRQHPASNKAETLCVEPANNSAVIQITEK